MSSTADGPVAQLESVSHRFGDFHVLRDVNLTVERGDVYGLLGLNGAGKTTTLRLMLGLITLQTGRISLFGRSPAHWLEIAPRIGAMIEAPALYPHLDGLTNLRLLHELAGSPAGRTPEAALELVGLSRAAHVQARRYSQGMQQRLYVAQALLGRPDLLMLDEPTSNLDPRGIFEVREMIRRLSQDEGVTVILSSHQLHEVEDVCNRIAILHKGQRVAEAEMRTLFGEDASWFEIGSPRAAEVLDVLAGLPWCREPQAAGEDRVRTRVPRERRAELNAALVQKGLPIVELVERRPTLEDYFRHAVEERNA
jgi:ABC-2 type transport system ATP-binding protein